MQTKRRARLGVRSLALASIALTIAVLGTGTALGAIRTPPLKGPIPREANIEGVLDLSLVPQFITALGRDGIPVGYVSRDQALALVPPPTDRDGRPMGRTIPVYGEDLVTVVGHMVPDRGFVPLGTEFEAVPTFKVEVAPIEAQRPTEEQVK